MILFGSYGADQSKTQTIDGYLACVNSAHRDALQQLRQTIQAIAPNAEECISCAIARVRLNRCCLLDSPPGQTIARVSDESKALKNFQNELRNFQTSKGTLRFSPDKPMPVALVKKLLKAHESQRIMLEQTKTGENREQSQSSSRHKKRRVHPHVGWRAQTMES